MRNESLCWCPKWPLVQKIFGEAVCSKEMLGVAPGRMDSLLSVRPGTNTPLLGMARGYSKAPAVLPQLQLFFQILFSQFRIKCRHLRTHFFTSMTLTLYQSGFVGVTNKNRFWFNKTRKPFIWNILEVTPRHFWKVWEPGSKYRQHQGRLGVGNYYENSHHGNSLNRTRHW